MMFITGDVQVNFCSTLALNNNNLPAETTLNSKLVADFKEFFSEMVVRGMNILGPDLDYMGIGMKKVGG